MANEAKVDIGRNARPLFVDGKHPLAIAKLLDLSNLPVAVVVRHLECISGGNDSLSLFALNAR